MIGIIPGQTKTFTIMGDFNSSELVEGSLYFDPKDKRLYYYSTTETRSNPENGFFPIWDGKNKILSNFSNEKYFDDSLKVDIASMANAINQKTAATLRYNQRRTDNQNTTLSPMIINEDNMFTQTIKGTISAMNITMVDLIDMATPKLNQNIVESYYNSLSKITLMRMDKWLVWMDAILHTGFVISVYRDTKLLVTYRYPEDVYETGIIKYDSITNLEIDFLKKIIKIVMVMENITKAKLRSEMTDEYTINNLMTSLNGNKPLSAQLFSRFMRMAQLTYTVSIIDRNKKPIFIFNQ